MSIMIVGRLLYLVNLQLEHKAKGVVAPSPSLG